MCRHISHAGGEILLDLANLIFFDYFVKICLTGSGEGYENTMSAFRRLE